MYFENEDLHLNKYGFGNQELQKLFQENEMNSDNINSDSQSSTGVSSSIMSPDTTMQETMHDDYNSYPYLKITEQPADEFRFRYKSEMQGAHGAILGMNSNNRHGKTFPSVKLHNYSGHAIIRCTLATASEERCVHAHRLVAKVAGRDKELEEPHDIPVGPETFEAQFQNMVIIHIEKKKVFQVLEEKMKNLLVCRSSKSSATITPSELNKIKEKAKHFGQNMDMNQVSLKFEALRRTEDNRLEDICPPVYTIPINNLKSHERGKLKICRIDRHIGSCRGGEEVFIFVEKVSKQNIKVKFYELDDERRETWCDFATFKESDVHHQYAIAFRTPPYKDPGISQNVRVSICLYRPSDRGVSEPIEFLYKPDHLSKKRKLSPSMTYEDNLSNKQYLVPDTTTDLSLPQDVVDNIDIYMDSFSMLNEDSFFSDVVLPNGNGSLPSNPSINDILSKLPTPDAEEYVKHLNTLANSDDFENYAQLINPRDVATDGMYMTRAYKKLFRCFMAKCGFSLDNFIIRKHLQALNCLLQNKKIGKIEKSKFTQLVERLLNCSLDGEENRLLHLLIEEVHLTKLEKLANFIEKEVDSKLKSNLINAQNSHKETPLHVAVKKGLTPAVTIILSTNAADISKMDEENRTPLHYAVIHANETNKLEILRTLIDSSININENEICDEGTPLHIAIRKPNNVEVVNVLLKHSDIDVNILAGSARETPLHIAIDNLDVNIVKLLVNKCKEYNKELKIHLENAKGQSPVHRCKELVESKSTDISNKARHIASVLSINLDEYIAKGSENSLDSLFLDTVIKTEEDDIITTYEEITGFYDKQVLRELGTLMDKNGRWRDLACYLGYKSLMNQFFQQANPTTFMLLYIENYGGGSQAILHKIQNFFLMSHFQEEAEIFGRLLKRKNMYK